MANNETDKYIESLCVGDSFNYEGNKYTILTYDQYNVITACGCKFSWGDIAEDYEMMQLEEKINNEADLSLNKHKDV